MTPFLGQIQPFGFNFATVGWTFCDGQLLSIAQNSALFALLGTTYGGNGQTTFALPDLRGRSIVHIGHGAGLSQIVQGQIGGTETVTLTGINLPAHNHPVTATTNDATLDEPATGVRFGTAAAAIYSGTGTGTVKLALDSTTGTGGGTPFSNRSPYLGVPFSIALEGIFPSRN